MDNNNRYLLFVCNRSATTVEGRGGRGVHTAQQTSFLGQIV